MSERKKVLVLGAGLVAAPLIRYLAHAGYDVTAASLYLPQAQQIVQNLENANALAADVSDTETLNRLVPQADLVVSLVPHTLHLYVARACLAHKRHMITASYIKPEIKAMEAKVKAAGLTFLNEIGLDPGIDHMSAMAVIDSIAERGGKLVGFSSSTGGLPAPDANDNPLGYKLSWSPRGVVLAGMNEGRFLKDGQEIVVPAKELFAHTWPLHIDELGDFEVYTNRDCIGYIELYGLSGVMDMFRGTIRYPGWCTLWDKLHRIGYLDIEVRKDLPEMTYDDLTRMLIAKKQTETNEQVELAFKLDKSTMEKMEWLGLFDKRQIGENVDTILDALVELMQGKMEYKPGERDMIIMQHRFDSIFEEGRCEVMTSTLIDYGIPHGDSSMSRTVALPAAVAADLLLQGKIQLRGVLAPTHREIYKPVLARLEELGIRFKERTLT